MSIEVVRLSKLHTVGGANDNVNQESTHSRHSVDNTRKGSINSQVLDDSTSTLIGKESDLSSSLCTQGAEGVES